MEGGMEEETWERESKEENTKMGRKERRIKEKRREGLE